MAKQVDLDNYAQQLGFQNYNDYRNFLAQQMGYKNYYQQRIARASGSGLKGDDASNPRYEVRPEEPFTPSIPVIREDTIPGVDLTGFDASGYALSADSFTGGIAAAADATDAAMQSILSDAVDRLDYLQAGSPSRVRTVRNNVVANVDQFRAAAADYYTNTFPQIYREGAIRGSGNLAYQLTNDDLAQIARFQQQGLSDLEQASQFATRDARQQIPSLRSATDQEALDLIKSGIKGARYSDGRRYDLSGYSKMSVDANAARAYNTATVLASQAEWFEVNDGSGCGWTDHNDPDIADGSIRSKDDCLAYGIAHPHCQRTFTPRPDLNKENVAEAISQALAKAVGVAEAHPVAAATLLGLGAGAVGLAASDELRSRAFDFSLRQFTDVRTRLQAFSNVLKRDILEHRLQPFIDLETGEPVLATPQRILADLHSYADDYAQGKALPSHVYKLLGIEEGAPAKVVGDAFEPFMTYADMNMKSKLSLSSLSELFDLETHAYNQFYDYVQRYTGSGKYARFTFPRLGSRTGKRRGKRFTFDPFKLIRLSSTTTVQDVEGKIIKLPSGWETKLPDTQVRQLINHLSLNRNGLARLGFSSDPRTGFFSPTFRLVPKGPLRLATKINRGIEGNVTSLTAELRLITKYPVNFTSSFNLDLRALGIEKAKDIFNLRPSDFLKLHKEDVNWISAAAELRIKGFNIFDFTRVFRVTRDQAQNIWDVTNQYIKSFPEKYRTELANLRALQARERFYTITGEGGNWQSLQQIGKELGFSLGTERSSLTNEELDQLLRTRFDPETAAISTVNPQDLLVRGQAKFDIVQQLDEILKPRMLPEQVWDFLDKYVVNGLGIDRTMDGQYIPTSWAEIEANPAERYIVTEKDVFGNEVFKSGPIAVPNSEVYKLEKIKNAGFGVRTMADPLSNDLLRQHMVDQLVHQWAITASDESPLSMSIQTAAKEVFGLTIDDRPPSLERIMEEISQFSGGLDFQQFMQDYLDNKFALGHAWYWTLSDAEKQPILDEINTAYDQAAHTNLLPAAKMRLDTFNHGYQAIQDSASAKEVLREFVRAQYENTQRYLANFGIDEVTLYRGMTFTSGAVPDWAPDVVNAATHYQQILSIFDDLQNAMVVAEDSFGDQADYIPILKNHLEKMGVDPEKLRGFSQQGLIKQAEALVEKAKEDAVKVVEMTLQPISSFSTNADIAASIFGSGGPDDIGLMMGIKVPASQILSTARTGVGALNELEATVLGSVGQARVILTELLEQDPEMYVGINYGFQS